MIRYAYELTDFPRWAGGLSQLLHIPAGGGKTGISPPAATGFIRTGRLYNGISFTVIDLTLKEELTVTVLPSASAGLLLQFNLESNHPTLRLCSTGNERETVYPRHSRVRKIGILATGSFLRHHLLKPILAELFRQASLRPNSFSEPIPFDNKALLEEILYADPSTPLHRLHVHNRLLLLAEKFLYASINKTPQPQPGSIHWAKAKEKDLEALREVMKMLSNSTLQKFPSIQFLSKTATMSSTKLKTRFKQIYGMKLYEFYNHHRLLQAKEMLRTGDYSVKQVGVNIGFTNLSNFAKAFKKEFGVLPREILKSK
jgi:AraC-like DNA-binding protein